MLTRAAGDRYLRDEERGPINRLIGHEGGGSEIHLASVEREQNIEIFRDWPRVI